MTVGEPGSLDTAMIARGPAGDRQDRPIRAADSLEGYQTSAVAPGEVLTGPAAQTRPRMGLSL